MGKKSIFNFYLDNDIKQEVIKKLEEDIGGENKGQLAALIRVQLKEFLSLTPEVVRDIYGEKIKTEYLNSTLRNKRSKL